MSTYCGFLRLRAYISLSHVSAQSICRYFGETIDENDESVRKTYCGGMCDVSGASILIMSLAVTCANTTGMQVP